MSTSTKKKAPRNPWTTLTNMQILLVHLISELEADDCVGRLIASSIPIEKFVVWVELSLNDFWRLTSLTDSQTEN